MAQTGGGIFAWCAPCAVAEEETHRRSSLVSIRDEAAASHRSSVHRLSICSDDADRDDDEFARSRGLSSARNVDAHDDRASETEALRADLIALILEAREDGIGDFVFRCHGREHSFADTTPGVFQLQRLLWEVVLRRAGETRGGETGSADSPPSCVFATGKIRFVLAGAQILQERLPAAAYALGSGAIGLEFTTGEWFLLQFRDPAQRLRVLQLLCCLKYCKDLRGRLRAIQLSQKVRLRLKSGTSTLRQSVGGGSSGLASRDGWEVVPPTSSGLAALVQGFCAAAATRGGGKCL